MLSARTAVERKRSDDLIASVMHKRLQEQLAALREQFERPIHVVESHYLYANRHLSADFVRLQLAMFIVTGVSVLVTQDVEDTASLAAALAKLEQQGFGYEPSHQARTPQAAPNIATGVVEGETRLIVDSYPNRYRARESRSLCPR